MFFRIQKELHVRSYNLADTHRNAVLFEDILTIIRMNVHEFFTDYTNSEGMIHSQNDFRKFLELPQNSNLNSIIHFIERNIKVNV